MKVEEFKKIVDRALISEYLPYWVYDKERDIYINSDESIGFAVECYPLQYPLKKAYESILSALSILPEGSSIQIILYASPDIIKTVDFWDKNKKRTDELVKGIKESFKKFLEEKTWERISHNFGASVRDYRLFITVKYGGKEREYTVFDKIFNPKLFFEKQEIKTIEEKIKKISEVKDRFIGSLKILHPVKVDPKRLYNFLYPILNPSHDYREKLLTVPDENISDYLVANDTVVEIYDDYIKIDNIYGKSLSTKGYPEESSFLDVIDYVGNEITGEAFDSPFMIVLNAVKLSDKKKGEVRRNATLVLRQEMPYALFPSLKFKHQDLSYGMEKIEKGADLLEINLSFFVFAKDKDRLSSQIGAFKAYFRNKQFVLEEDKYINFAVLLSNLPFGYDLTMHSFLARGRAVFVENFVDIAPVCADWKGIKPEVLFLTPRGQLIGFDLFSSSAGGYNAFVVGTTGSGKSVLLQYIATNYYMSGKKIRIIDIGRSYERFAHIFDGQFIELNMNDPISLNPFTNLKELTFDPRKIGKYEENEKVENSSATDLEFLSSLFLLMGLPAEQKKAQELRKLMKAYLDEAILESWEKYKQDSCVDTVLEQLERYKNDDRVADFIRTMRPYTSKGLYGPFFNGESNIHFDADIVVMENDTIEQMPDLRDPAIMLLTYHIAQEIYMGYDPDFKYLVIIDEAHKFLGNPQIDLFVEQAYRRFRKHGASMILGTQGFEDFYGSGDTVSRAGRVIVQNSFWKFFLLQTATSRQALKKSNYFNLSEYEEAIMDSINPVKGEYGEGYLISENIKAKIRIVLDDFLKAMYFSDPEVRAKIKQYVESGMSYLEATRKVMQEIKG